MASWFERLKRNILGGPVPAEKKPESLSSADVVKKPSARTTSKIVRVVIGLDFGTSSTKVVFRKIGEKTAWVAPSPVTYPDFAWFCTPTTVETIDGTVHFGDLIKPEDRNGEVPLKLQLLDCSDGSGDMTAPEKKVIGYLGWILETAFDSVKAHYGVKEFQPILNIGTPVAFFGDEEVRRERTKHYASVARAALATTRLMEGPGIQNGMPMEQYALAINTAWHAKSDLDLVGVHPESISVLVSLQEDPAVDEGIYSVVDIGAGTTEVSTSSLFSPPQSTSSLRKRQIACYTDGTERGGIFDYPTGAKQGETQSAMDLLRRWWRQFEVNWELSRRKDAPSAAAHDAWRNTTILFTGGGGFHPDVRPHFQEQIKADSPAQVHFGKGGWSMPIQTYKPSEQALKPTRTSHSKERGAFHLAAVAHGLSFHGREWPDWYHPEDVAAVDGPENNPPPFDPADAGYHGR
jgi:hypothetical protein